MRPLRIQVLMHESLVPPETNEGVSDKEMLEWKTEYDVLATLHNMGHEAEPLGVSDDLSVLRDALIEKKPHIVFNLLEEFHGVPHYDQHVVSYLELMQQPYTGCNPRGLLLSHDKALSKKILTYHRIPTPHFTTFPRGRALRVSSKLVYPLMVKSAVDDASLGISQASIVTNEKKLKDRIEYLWEQHNSDVLVEEYIDGREFYVGLMGNYRLQVFPVWELLFENLPADTAPIATAKVKWDPTYQKKLGIKTVKADSLSNEQKRTAEKLSKRIYKVLGLSGYARMDFRMSQDGKFYALEANPNPNLSFGEDFAESAETIGISYEELLQKIIHLGRTYKPAWKVSG